MFTRFLDILNVQFCSKINWSVPHIFETTRFLYSTQLEPLQNCVCLVGDCAKTVGKRDALIFSVNTQYLDSVNLSVCPCLRKLRSMLHFFPFFIIQTFILI